MFFILKKEIKKIRSILILGDNINKYIKNELKISNELLSNINGYSLDNEQRKVVVSNCNAILVIAGAGSGKSLTIIGKIRYLIEQKNYSEKEILCITFTRDAANNLEKNIKKNYGYNINVYTFHKLALIILKGFNFKISNSDTLSYIVNEYFYFIKENEMLQYKVKKVLNKIDTSYSKILKSKELTELKKLIITFINLFKTNNYTIEYFLKMKKHKDLILIIFDIYYLYEEELRSTGTIDFNDMIFLATKYVKNNSIYAYKYVIVDEYQDTSYARYLLLKEIINKTGAKLICVGDDYQSIYRFNGCDIKIFLKFKKLFKKSRILKISNTYRNSQELINVAGSFIMKNRYQLYKKLKSSKSIAKPIKILFGDDLNKLINIVVLNHKNIFILGRNTFDINKYFETNKDGYINYKNANIRYLTIHKSKGLEAECVILINLIDDTLGMPNKIIDNEILKYVNNNKDLYPYEEERRLFYVAMTRTKNELYLLVNRNNMSIFVKEIIKHYKKYIEYI